HRGAETILFRADDFADPAHSAVFSLPEQYAALAPSARNFAAICRADVTQVPTLGDFRAGRNIPRAAAPVTAAASRADGATRVSAGPNRRLVAQLLGGEPKVRPGETVAPALGAARPSGRSNRAIVQALGSRPVE